LGLNGNDQVSLGHPFTTYDLHRSGNDFGSLPTAVFGLNGTGTNINIGTGTYSYLLATYVGRVSDSVIWYIGNLSGDITIPDLVNLTGWTLFGPGGVPGVPDGGTTVMLLGAALGALGMARRFLKA
jgi:VPDSG-CTERM motif